MSEPETENLGSEQIRAINKDVVLFGGADARLLIPFLLLIYIPTWWMAGFCLALSIGMAVANYFGMPPMMALRRLRVWLLGGSKSVRPNGRT